MSFPTLGLLGSCTIKGGGNIEVFDKGRGGGVGDGDNDNDFSEGGAGDTDLESLAYTGSCCSREQSRNYQVKINSHQ